MLVFSDLGISRSVTIALAYLIHRKKISLQVRKFFKLKFCNKRGPVRDGNVYSGFFLEYYHYFKFQNYYPTFHNHDLIRCRSKLTIFLSYLKIVII